MAGPWLGGYLTDNLSWRWVFYVTVPFAVVAAWVLVRHVDEDVRRDKVLPIDWPGASLLASGSTLLLLAILSGPRLLDGLGRSGCWRPRRSCSPCSSRSSVGRPTRSCRPTCSPGCRSRRRSRGAS